MSDVGTGKAQTAQAAVQTYYAFAITPPKNCCPKCRRTYPAFVYRALDNCVSCGAKLSRLYLPVVWLCAAVVTDVIWIAHLAKRLALSNCLHLTAMVLGWAVLLTVLDLILLRFSGLPKYRRHSLSGWLSFWIVGLIGLVLRDAIKDLVHST